MLLEGELANANEDAGDTRAECRDTINHERPGRIRLYGEPHHQEVPDPGGRLARGEYLAKHQNVIFLGNSGTGKTHLAVALGREACQQGHRVRFYTASGLVNELMAAQAELTLNKLEKRWLKYDLVIINQLGYIPYSKQAAELLFQFLSLRYERGGLLHRHQPRLRPLNEKSSGTRS